ncbi:type I-C CRISPR-associated protein Cas5c [Sphingomonas sp. PB4P5]|uniref:type I-C CRISPR-associated protein Cas5c n=1 Tax=Parasphingomonas puruogangriensis TaxID=3096155 RepID=UPI002FCABE2F
MEFRLLVRGDRACFRRPEFADDLVSYDVITPPTAREIFDAIYSGPALRWRIDEIRVLAPLRSTWMSLAEIEHGAGVPGIVAGRRDRRMAHVLRDLAYVVTAHVGDLPGATLAAEAFRDRAARQQFGRQPCLGHRSFLAAITLLDREDPWPDSAWAGSGAIDLGWMLYDGARDGDGSRFFRPIMIDGVIDLRRRESLILAG